MSSFADTARQLLNVEEAKEAKKVTQSRFNIANWSDFSSTGSDSRVDEGAPYLQLRIFLGSVIFAIMASWKCRACGKRIAFPQEAHGPPTGGRCACPDGVWFKKKGSDKPLRPEVSETKLRNFTDPSLPRAEIWIPVDEDAAEPDEDDGKE